MDTHLTDRVAIVTGGGQGIGEGIAQKLAAEGCHVVVVDQNQATAEAAASRIRALGRKALGFPVNVSSWDQVRSMVDRVAAEFGRVDILVNNAGISPKKDGRKILVHEIEPEQWDLVMAVNLKGVFHCIKAVVPIMMRQRSGRIVSISSQAAKIGFSGPAASHYAASKAGVSALTRFAAHELAPYNILVNAVAPGTIQTPMRKLTIPELDNLAIAGIPQGRFGTIDEVANAVVFLASDLASYITGEIMDVNGGSVVD
ncbi:MAG: SDR family oxidoreductase [candidate division NC10 bacterium]|nr:SDR family oxidoreductase [candidate division NC10 bacterium]MBI3086680.1 SDR family oxidoreductase [candidate division NC10 bacterium]